MAILNIKDPEAHQLAVELAQRTGQSLTQVVKDALRDRLHREKAQSLNQERLIQRVLGIAKRASSRPVLDSRSAEEILGYDEFGVPRS
jgi:antitoxin VapB